MNELRNGPAKRVAEAVREFVIHGARDRFAGGYDLVWYVEDELALERPLLDAIDRIASAYFAIPAGEPTTEQVIAALPALYNAIDHVLAVARHPYRPAPPASPDPGLLRERLTHDFASSFIRIRSAHNPKPGEPCAWCRLAAEQAAEAVVTNLAMQAVLRAALSTPSAETPEGTLDAAWAEAEAALPEGSVLRLEHDPSVSDLPTIAEAIDLAGDVRGHVDSASPAAALRALAARLTENREGDPAS